MAFNFPDSPAVNDEYTAHGVTYKWSGTVWVAQGGGTYVAKLGGDTMEGDFEVRAAGANLILNKLNDNYWPLVIGKTNGISRWSVDLGEGPDTGGNGGNGFAIERYNDAGAYVDSPIRIDRATGKTTFHGAILMETPGQSFETYGNIHLSYANPTIMFNNPLSTNQGIGFRALTTEWKWWVEVSAAPQYDFRFFRVDDAGVFPAVHALRLERLTGHAYFGGDISAEGRYKINGNVVINRESNYIALRSGSWDGTGSPPPDESSIYLGNAADPTIYHQSNLHFWYSGAVPEQMSLDHIKLNIPLTTPSTSSTTGALVVAGGVGIGGNLNVGGTIGVPVISASNYHLDGTIFAKREGVYTRIYDSEAVSVGAFGNSTEPTNYWRNTAHAFLPRAGGTPWATIDASGVAIAPTTPSTSPITGALRVAGGVGIAGALWLGGAFNFTGQGHIVHASVGAGFWYDASAAADRFFLGTETAGDTFRLFAATSGQNAFTIDGATRTMTLSGRIVAPLGSDNYLGDVTAARSPDIGVIHFGSAKSRYLYFDGTSYTLAGGNLVVGGNKVTATHYDATTATLGYQLGGVAALFRSGNYHVLQSQDGGGNLILGQAAEPSNYYTNTNHFFRDRANTVVMSLIGGSLTLQHAVPELVIAKSASGQAARIYGRTGGSNRWHITLGNQGAESGGDAGSEFVIARYLDNGASTTAMSIQRSNGAVIIPGAVTIQGATNVFSLGATGPVSFTSTVNLTSVGAIGQNTTGRIEIQAPAGHHSFISFHIAGQFATHFGLAPDGNFYMGGWSHPSVSYRFWTTRDFASVPAIGTFVANGRLAFAADYVHYYYVGFNEPYAGAVVTGMSPTDASGNATARYRYLQLYTTGWFTVGYA